jgi:hypothetical protein
VVKGVERGQGQEENLPIRTKRNELVKLSEDDVKS